MTYCSLFDSDSSLDSGIKKGDKIFIGDNLMEELIATGHDEKEMVEFVNKFMNTEQTAYNVYEYTNMKGISSYYVTVDFLCEIPIKACNKI